MTNVPYGRNLRIASFVCALALAALAGGCPGTAGGGSTSDETTTTEPNQPATLSAANHAPVANAGDNQTVAAGDEVILDGHLSSDPDGDRLAFVWRQIAGPKVELSDAFSTHARFFAPSVTTTTTLTFSLQVADGLAASSADVSVTV